MMTRAAAGSPWYHHFWPWFIVILLGVSVLASIGTVYVAFVHRDVEIDRSVPMTPPDRSFEIDDGR
jgi:uncharacterized membrane protein YadS